MRRGFRCVSLGLQALELVEGAVEGALDAGLMAGEGGHGVRILQLFAAVLLTAPALAEVKTEPANPLAGSWQLVAAIPANMQDSEPNGIRNLRLRFDTDGKATLVDPTETLANARARNVYAIEGSTLTLSTGAQAGEGELHAGFQLHGENATLVFAETGMAWTLRRIGDAAIEKERIAPESVEYFPPATPAAVVAYTYDQRDDSALAPTERLLGQWEVVEISGYGPADFPPYGAPNDVWQFGKQRIQHFSRSSPDEGPGVRDYQVRGAFLQMQGGAAEELVPYSFDRWRRLVVGDPKEGHTVLKRINRDAEGKVSLPPLRIVLGYARGDAPE